MNSWKRSATYCVIIATLMTSGVFGVQLTPRAVFVKPQAVTKPTGASTLTLKFRDDLKVRCPGGNLSAPAGADITGAYDIVKQFELSFDPLISLPQETLTQIQERAATRSGRAQADLGGMMIARGDDDVLQAAASALPTTISSKQTRPL